MNKTYTIKHNCICTKNQQLTEGNEYLYKEGSHRNRIILEQVLEHGEWLRLLVFFPHRSKTIEISHRNVDYVYSGIWRIFDLEEEYNNFTDNSDSDEMEEKIMNAIKPKITKEKFLNSLRKDQIESVQLHLKIFYPCKKWGKHEQNLAYLAFLLGEGHLALSDHWMWHEISEIEFNHKDYEISFESDVVKGVNIEFTRVFYQLDKLYDDVLKN